MPKSSRGSLRAQKQSPDSRENVPRLISTAKGVTRLHGAERRPTVGGVHIGVLLEPPKGGEYLVEFSVDGNNHRALARMMSSGASPRVGQKLVLAFEEGDQLKPVILGSLSDAPEARSSEAERNDQAPSLRVEASVDGRKVVVSAEDEIVLSCGKASITLTRAGKVIIRGEYLVSRPTGVNCIRGGVVQIN